LLVAVLKGDLCFALSFHPGPARRECIRAVRPASQTPAAADAFWRDPQCIPKRCV